MEDFMRRLKQYGDKTIDEILEDRERVDLENARLREALAAIYGLHKKYDEKHKTSTLWYADDMSALIHTQLEEAILRAKTADMESE